MKISKRAKRIEPSLTLEITAKAKKMKAEGRDVVSFGAGEPDFDTPQYIVKAAKKALDEGMTRYTPAAGTPSLRKAIAEKLKRENGLSYDPDDIVVSSGAKQSLQNALLVTVDEGDEVIIPLPYWLTYPELVKLADGVPVFVETDENDDYKLTPEKLEKAITEKTRVIILNSPNNPSGVVYSKQELAALAEVLEKHEGIYVISDEIYENLVYDGAETVSFAALSENMKERTIIINGVSKTYAMTGWRIGYTASSRELAKAMGSMQSHTSSNPNTIAQYATEAALCGKEGEQFIEKMQTEFGRRRNLMIESLRGEDRLWIIEPEGAFYCMVNVQKCFGLSYKGKKIDSALSFAKVLLEEKNVAVIPCEPFGAPSFIRLSYALSPSDIEKGVERIKEFARELK